MNSFTDGTVSAQLKYSNTAAYKMPRPTTIVQWQHAPGGEFSPAIVTRVGRTAISVMVFPTESRVGVPKDGVSHVSDPRAKTMVAPESGLWDFTEEYRVVQKLVEAVEKMGTELEVFVHNLQSYMERHSQAHAELATEIVDLRDSIASGISQPSGPVNDSADIPKYGRLDDLARRVEQWEQGLAALKDHVETQVPPDDRLIRDFMERVKNLEEAYLTPE